MPQQVYAEDYSCIIDSNQGIGGLYIGNLEAAQNLPNLKRTPFSTQDCKSRLSSQQQKESIWATQEPTFPTSSIYPSTTMNPVTLGSFSIRPPISSMIALREPTLLFTVWPEFPAQCLSSYLISSNTRDTLSRVPLTWSSQEEESSTLMMVSSSSLRSSKENFLPQTWSQDH